jgi:hypothetical protein
MAETTKLSVEKALEKLRGSSSPATPFSLDTGRHARLRPQHIGSSLFVDNRVGLISTRCSLEAQYPERRQCADSTLPDLRTTDAPSG